MYRGLNLDDQQRKQLMKETRSRKVAEFYDGNTLLIIDLNQRDNNHKYIACGRSISSLSDFPEEEEEFLIWPGRDFAFVKYEYDILEKGNANFALVTFAVDFCQLAKVIFLLDFRRTMYKITALAKNLTFANWQKSTAKVTTAKFMLPLEKKHVIYLNSSD